MRKALITGITGQDGSYLAEFLLGKGYEVYGLVRCSSHVPFERIQHIIDRIKIVNGDMTDQSSLDHAVQEILPDEVYNLAAQSFVPASWSQPILTSEVTALGVLRLLDAIRCYSPKTRFYQASSSEMFGNTPETPQSELTRFQPRSPYGVSKVYGHYIAINYRESYGLFAASGICFNHESPRRGLEFITRKVSHGVAKIALGLAEELKVGCLDAKRDWGFAGDYVEAMWLMLQQPEPEDFVVATGEAHSIQELIELAFATVNLEWKKYVKVDTAFIRPAEISLLQGNPSKANRRLGWKPKVGFKQLIQRMVEADLAALKAAAPARGR